MENRSLNKTENYKKNSIGEILAVSAEKATAALWPEKYLPFGALVVTQENTHQNTLYVCTNITHKPMDNFHVIKPLQMTTEELENQYPHLNSYIFYEIELLAISSISTNNFQFLFSKECPKLHSWIQPFDLTLVATKENFKLLFEKIINLDTLETTKKNITTNLLLNIFSQSSIKLETKKLLLEMLFVQLQSLFKTNLEALINLYSEAEQFLIKKN